MHIRFYKNDNLKYSSRKRIKDISNYDSFVGKIYNSVKLNNGAYTSIITDTKNICDYVTIDDTRWFVVSYTYKNGSQVELYLQRDVIGEFSLDNFYGKIERGYTDTLLRNRKELDLNQILKQRIPIQQEKSLESIRGNYKVDTLNSNEMWGILYFSKNNNEEIVSVNIPEFSVPATEITQAMFLDEGLYEGSTIDLSYSSISIGFDSTGIIYTAFPSGEVILNTGSSYNVKLHKQGLGGSYEQIARDFARQYYDFALRRDIEYQKKYSKISNSTLSTLTTNPVKYENKFYLYNYVSRTTSNFGVVNIPNNSILSMTGSNWHVLEYNYTLDVAKNFNEIRLNRKEIDSSEIGEFQIPISLDIVSEPFSILAFPLFDTTIKGKYKETEKEWNVNKTQQFQIFNNIIRAESGGSNPLLIDAQIIPYCPVLLNAVSEFSPNNSQYSSPIFSLASSSFEFETKISLNPSVDVKFDYITREYSIVSPDGTGKFNFNFYDYTNDIIKDTGNIEINTKQLTFLTKLCLKPFSVIGSCNAIPETNSIYGITYSSDLRGCNPSNNGFQSSLSSNAYQTYLRENSNYQQIFNLQKEQLQKQLAVEKSNEISSIIMNTITGATMGAIGGASVGQSIFGNIGAGVGAGIGAGVAGAAVSSAMGIQFSKNEELREYEMFLQQANFDLQIGQIKNLPNQISRISSFNEITLKDFYFAVEVYECTEAEKIMIRKYIDNFSYALGVVDYYINYLKTGKFIKGNLLKSGLVPVLHDIAVNELLGGIYYE